MSWWCIDLPEAVKGANCLPCFVDGLEVRAEFADRLGAPNCEAHFIGQLQAARVILTRDESLARHRANRRRGGAGGRASAARRRARKEGGSQC